MIKQFTHVTAANHPLSLTLYGADHLGSAPCIIYVHGFKGYKDWAFVPYVGEYFASQGYAFLCFNFSHNGIGPDGETFTALDKFEQNTFLLEVSELQEVIKLVAHTNQLGADLHAPLGIIGHSRGGGIALLGSARQPEVKAVATWASVSTFERFPKEVIDAWKEAGYHEVVNSRTGQVMRLGMPILKEVERYGRSRLNILQAVQQFERPLLILHGEEDESVPAYEAEQLNIYGDPDATMLRLIPKADHTFGAKHPFSGPTTPLTQVLEGTVQFFDQYLR
jgi:dienelactone hydrolase